MSMDPFPASDDESAGQGAGQLSTSELMQPVKSEFQGSLRVLVTGADGFIGRHLLPRLVSRGHRVRALVRRRRAAPSSSANGIEWCVADLTDRGALAGVASGCDRVVHLAGNFETVDGVRLGRVHGTGTRNLVWEILKSDVDRIVLVSALGASPDGGEFFRSKFEAEDIVLSCSVEHLILRPSVIYGPGDHFTVPVARILKSLPVFPMMGDGTFQLQPLAVEDMVDILTQGVERSDLGGRSVDLAGPERLSFVRIVRIVGKTIGHARPILPLPAAFAAPTARIAAALGLPRPFPESQLDILRYGSVLQTDVNPVRSLFHIKPLPFADAVTDYLELDR
ncbi:MAG: NAD-dependent epimerase/dehydratase family protein [marine benthic group bacterium]|nr:NAD-dependent epimerase/dehydratase family protein [Gemmatimonadota bacterium]